jgi:protein SCO1/2
MRAYLASFDPTFIGGTGTPAQLAQVYKDFGATGGLNHSTSVYLIDREGRLRAMAPYGKSAADIAHDAAILLEK